MRKILYAQSIPIRTIRDWYGDDVGDLVLAITDVVRSDGIAAGTKCFYDTHLLECVEVDESQRLLSNRINGCPSFYPTKSVTFSVNDFGGFLEYRLPERTREMISDPELILGVQGTVDGNDDVQVNRPYRSVAYIYPEYDSAFEANEDTWMILHHAFPSSRSETVFGKAAQQYANVIDAIIENTMVYKVPAKYMRGYHAYFVTMYENDTHFFDGERMPSYRGLVYTNLLRGCPVFFPNADGQSYLNVQYATVNDAMPVTLSNGARNEIRDLVEESNVNTIVW